MAGLTDLLGALVQSGMSNISGAGSGNSGGLGGMLGNVLGGITGNAGQSGTGGSTGNPGSGSGGGLGGMLGSVLGGITGNQTAAGGLGGMLSNVLGGIAGNQTAAGGLGALAGALLGGGSKATAGAVGGGALAVLASLAVSALQNAGQKPAQMPHALSADALTQQQQVEMEADTTILVKAMINAAKADGNISQQETEQIIGKLEEGESQEESKQFFLAEAAKPMDTQTLFTAAKGRPELAAQIYAASLLAIMVDTPKEIAVPYMSGLAAGLGLSPQVTQHIEQSLGAIAAK